MRKIFLILFLVLFLIGLSYTKKAKPKVSLASTHVKTAIERVSEQKLREYLTNLTDNDDIAGPDQKQTRYSPYNGEKGKPRGNRVEAEYIKSHFDSLGLESSFQDFTVGGAGTRNIIGRIKGRKENEVYILTSHMDSTAAMSGTNNPAPGADDNGSGTVLVMESARVLKSLGVSFEYSLEFIAFSGEEQGLIGSYYYVDHIPQGKVVKGVINVDMVGYGPNSECVNFYYWPNTGSNILTSKILEVNSKYNIELNIRTGSSTNGRSDHAAFGYAGKPAAFGYECGINNNPTYHSVQDTMDKINFSQLTKTAKAVAGALVELANAESLPLPNTPTPGGPTTTNSPGIPPTTPTATPVLPAPTSKLYNCYPDPKCSSGQKNIQLCPLICYPK